MSHTEEHRRLRENKGTVPLWQKWGPYVTERSWGTVREDYSAGGDSWNYFTHDDAIKKVYRWGDDGIAGWCDRYQVLLFAPVFWNGNDPILKERLFGLNFWEGNHGEDVKECYYHLDGTPSHSYMKYLYRYPHAAFPYQKLRDENKERSAHASEYELVDTGIFDENRFFDITIEYAKASAEDTCIRITAVNRGPEKAPLHILPHLWFRNQWSWGADPMPHPLISKGEGQSGTVMLVADERAMNSPSNLLFTYKLGTRYLYAPSNGATLFTNNEDEGKSPYTKDAFHRAVIRGEKSVNPEHEGTKACIHYYYEMESQEQVVLHFRLSNEVLKKPLEGVGKIFEKRIAEADSFYATVHPRHASDEEKKIQRQAIAGTLWSKQFYYFDVDLWFKGDVVHERQPSERFKIRNFHWKHLNSMRVLLMPDKWEYPWFAAWDLAFHCLTLALVDIESAKEQLWLLFFDQFMHPNGQIPAYEWEFSDMNPPVQAWAALYLIRIEKEQTGKFDRHFLRRCFDKLLLNFGWWVNKVDSEGYNVFEGGFLGLDNITVIDRSMKLNEGQKLEQSDGTGWMAFYCLGLMRMALELAKQDKAYEMVATKFFQHYAYIAYAMKKRDDIPYNLWSEEDGFFYDVLRFSSSSFLKMKVRSLVGIIPLYAVDYLTKKELEEFPEFTKNLHWFLNNKSHVSSSCTFLRRKGGQDCYVFSLLDAAQLKRVLKYIWDPNEFRADYGFRSLSIYHKEHPFKFEEKSVYYEPGESVQKIKGGNSNWRGPVWFPTSFLLIESLLKFEEAFGDELAIDDEQGRVNPKQIATSFANRMISIFKKDEEHKLPFLGPSFRYQGDPNWTDHLLFYEHFHPETGQGIGASHQTGWTALVANLISNFRKPQK